MATHKTIEEIAAIIFQRRLHQSLLLEQMIKVRDRYNGDVVIPLPNTANEKPVPPALPMLIANAIDNLAVRAGSVTPTIQCPALDPSQQTGRRSVEYARTRRRALSFAWEKSYLNLGLRRAFRHLAGYMTTALDVAPDLDYGRPCLKVRDPLTAYPEPKAAEDLTPPADIGYIYAKSRQWLLKNYPDQAGKVVGAYNYVNGTTQLWDVVEWIDENDIVLGVLGPRSEWRQTPGWDGQARYSIELRRWENKAGRCTSYIPARVTMDRIANQVANMVGVVDLMSLLVELDVRATQRSVYPDRYIMAKAGQSPQLVGGKWKDGASGEVNIIIDADTVGQLHGTPDAHNMQMVDRMERAVNLTAGVIPAMGGENNSNLRTGRAIDSIFAASIDPRIQEMHEIMEIALHEANEIVIACWKGYWPKTKVVGYSGWPSDRGLVEFTPEEHFETEANVVSYPIPGADAQTITVMLSQLYGTDGAISMDTYRHLHPFISDPDGEAHRHLVDEVQKMELAALGQRAAQGGIPPVDMAFIEVELEKGVGLAQAIIEIDKRAQERQAQIAQQAGEEQGEPQFGAAPGAQPGLGNPGEGGQQLPPQIAQPPAGLDNFRQLVRDMRSPQSGLAAQARVGAPSA